MGRKAEREREQAELSQEELEEQDAEELPDREALSIVDPISGFTLPVEPPD